MKRNFDEELLCVNINIFIMQFCIVYVAWSKGGKSEEIIVNSNVFYGILQEDFS